MSLRSYFLVVLLFMSASQLGFLAVLDYLFHWCYAQCPFLTFNKLNPRFQPGKWMLIHCPRSSLVHLSHLPADSHVSSSSEEMLLRATDWHQGSLDPHRSFSLHLLSTSSMRASVYPPRYNNIYLTGVL